MFSNSLNDLEITEGGETLPKYNFMNVDNDDNCFIKRNKSNDFVMNHSNEQSFESSDSFINYKQDFINKPKANISETNFHFYKPFNELSNNHEDRSSELSDCNKISLPRLEEELVSSQNYTTDFKSRSPISTGRRSHFDISQPMYLKLKRLSSTPKKTKNKIKSTLKLNESVIRLMMTCSETQSIKDSQFPGSSEGILKNCNTFYKPSIFPSTFSSISHRIQDLIKDLSNNEENTEDSLVAGTKIINIDPEMLLSNCSSEYDKAYKTERFKPK